jgi:hypothetical protein
LSNAITVQGYELRVADGFTHIDLRVAVVPGEDDMLTPLGIAKEIIQGIEDPVPRFGSGYERFDQPCTRAGCRYVNPSGAIFCMGCGVKLKVEGEADGEGQPKG